MLLEDSPELLLFLSTMLCNSLWSSPNQRWRRWALFTEWIMCLYVIYVTGCGYVFDFDYRNTCVVPDVVLLRATLTLCVLVSPSSGGWDGTCSKCSRLWQEVSRSGCLPTDSDRPVEGRTPTSSCPLESFNLAFRFEKCRQTKVNLSISKQTVLIWFLLC